MREFIQDSDGCRNLHIAIGIATSGRCGILTEVIDYLARQTRLPDCLYVCPASPEDIDISCFARFPGPSFVVAGSRGSAAQRNAIIRAAANADIMVFFDDDFLAEFSYLAEIERLFQSEAGVVIATGHVLADGILGPGLAVSEGLSRLAQAGPLPASTTLTPSYSGYGCNMAVRLKPALENQITFDENLPLYGWWEDVDFSRRLAPYGRIVHSNRIRGVHLGTKTGRSPGKSLGYSQVANLVYLCRKGSISWPVAAEKISRNVAANLLRSVRPEPWVDRRGRLAGNLLAFFDWAKRSIAPMNILQKDRFK